MIFLFEQFAYSEKFLQDVLPLEKKGGNWDLPKGFVTKSKSGGYTLDGVGYFFNKNAKKSTKDTSNRIVFVLPKVFLEEGNKAFGKEVKEGTNFTLENAPKDFLANLSMWVCSSIAQYRKANPSDKDIEAPDARNFGTDKQAPTLIDVMNAMKLFYAENRNLFVFTAKNKHSGNNRIDWRRTVAHTQPFMQGDTPIYMELENKKKVFDLDDRLLVLFFSAMNYIEETFGFKMPKSEFYAPIRVNEFRRLLGHRGLVELRRIKHKYFADRFLKLYNIVKAFFEWGGTFSANDFESEYLLTSKYNNVFEAMMTSSWAMNCPSRWNT
ncbi:MAG: LlaJI family restriction endonuclease [Fibrobacter sp.]|nr:LlaJI family restriction endonuclease [Fibrobacter sp.]